MSPIFIALMTFTWGLWLVCTSVQLCLLHLSIPHARMAFNILLVFMGLLLLWSFILYWRQPKLARGRVVKSIGNHSGVDIFADLCRTVNFDKSKRSCSLMRTQEFSSGQTTRPKLSTNLRYLC